MLLYIDVHFNPFCRGCIVIKRIISCFLIISIILCLTPSALAVVGGGGGSSGSGAGRRGNYYESSGVDPVEETAHIEEVSETYGSTTFTNDGAIKLHSIYSHTLYSSSSSFSNSTTYSPDNSSYPNPETATTGAWPDGNWGVNHFEYALGSGNAPSTSMTLYTKVFYTLTLPSAGYVKPASDPIAYDRSGWDRTVVNSSLETEVVENLKKMWHFGTGYGAYYGGAYTGNNADFSLNNSGTVLNPIVTWQLSLNSSCPIVSADYDVLVPPSFWFIPTVNAVDMTTGITSPTTRAGSLVGNFGYYRPNDTLATVENTSIVNEGDSTVYNPVTNNSYTYDSYTYDYSDRSYNVTTTEGDNITVTYGDENVTIVEGDTIYNIYYVVPDAPDPETSPTTSPDPDSSPTPTGGGSGSGDGGTSWLSWANNLLQELVGDTVEALWRFVLGLLEDIYHFLEDLLGFLWDFMSQTVFGSIADFFGSFGDDDEIFDLFGEGESIWSYQTAPVPSLRFSCSFGIAYLT